MARSYVDIPILVLKVWNAAAGCTIGHLQKGGDLTGFVNASAINAACGVYATKTMTDSGWGQAMIVGTFWATVSDTLKAGAPAQWADTAGAIDSCNDTMSQAIGTVIDPVAAAGTRTTRVLIFGTPTNMTVWNA